MGGGHSFLAPGAGIGLAVVNPGRRLWSESRRPYEFPASLLGIERRNLPATLPKLNVVAVNELPSVSFCALIVGRYEFDGPTDMAIVVQNVRPVFGHFRPPHARQFIDHRKSFWSVRFRTRNQIKTWW
jgi:hypothetical protein